MNRNKIMNPQYVRQQEAIKEICAELGLVAYYPNYHADKNDKNSVLIYTKEAHEYNQKLPQWASSSENKPYVCHFENTDVNGFFDLNWMNYGKVDCRCGTDVKEKIRAFIVSNLEKYNNSKKPDCYTEGEGVYPLCIGESAEKCDWCCLYENYKGDTPPER